MAKGGGGMHDEGGWARMAGGKHGGGMCGGGHAWQGVCMAGGVHGREGAWVAGETVAAADGMHRTGMHSCLTY